MTDTTRGQDVVIETVANTYGAARVLAVGGPVRSDVDPPVLVCGMTDDVERAWLYVPGSGLNPRAATPAEIGAATSAERARELAVAGKARRPADGAQATPDAASIPVDAIVSTGDLPVMLGVSRMSVVRYRRRDDFPAPIKTVRGPGAAGEVELYDARAIEKWRAARG